MIANVDVNKLIDLLIKYKTQVSYLIAFVMCLLCFAGGRLTAQCPPKSVVCEAEEEITSLFIWKDLTTVLGSDRAIIVNVTMLSGKTKTKIVSFSRTLKAIQI